MEVKTDKEKVHGKSLKEIAEKANASFVDDHGLREYFIGQDLRRAFLSDLTLACQSCDDHGLRRAFLSALAEACQSRDQRIQRLEKALENQIATWESLKNDPSFMARSDFSIGLEIRALRAALSEENKNEPD